jgi:glycosyltransferase involved in cell wall biosynthesis
VGNERTGRIAVAFHEPVVGGAAIAVLRVLPELERRGWEFTFWTPGPGALRDELAGRGYEVAGEERLLRYSRAALSELPGPARRLASVPGYLARFRRWVRAEAPVLLHANTLIAIPEALTVRGTGVPALLYVHEILPAGLRGAVAARLIRRAARTVVTNSHASAAALRAQGVEAGVIHNGLVVPGPAPPRGPRRGPVIGTLGTISHRKGSDLFLALADRIREEIPNAEFRMVGPCPGGAEASWSQQVVEGARARGIEWRVVTDPFAELREWDALVMPSRNEPFGLAVVEAMAVGLPVVATSVGGLREIVTPDVGYLVPSEDLGELAKAVLALCRDERLRSEMGARARTRVEREFTVEKQAAALDRAYAATVAR